MLPNYNAHVPDTGRTYHLSKDNEKKITDTFNRMWSINFKWFTKTLIY